MTGRAIIRYMIGISQKEATVNVTIISQISTVSGEISSFFGTSALIMYTGTKTMEITTYAMANDAANPMKPHLEK